jgi:hypothetical protein
LRSDSSPSSLGTVSEVKAQSRLNHKEALYSLAIKPDKMREPGGVVGLERKRNTKKDWERNRTRENFGPSTSSTSCFYHHCLRLERRRLHRELKEEKGQNRGAEREKKKPRTVGNKKHKDDTKTQGEGEKQTKKKQGAGE